MTELKNSLIQKVLGSSLKKLVFFDGKNNNDEITLRLIVMTRPSFFTEDEKIKIFQKTCLAELNF